MNQVKVTKSGGGGVCEDSGVGVIRYGSWPMVVVCVLRVTIHGERWCHVCLIVGAKILE